MTTRKQDVDTVESNRPQTPAVNQRRSVGSGRRAEK